ncbi:Hypothetical predicted protein [Mytilus galloprovincialis]|uniref:B box-type domain-containing protein n=1 Tax=Mytilus galloprovincialis TaxID=29158 RepID=A0A8B6CT19_MYTGA|nr:Hypothetical predicted protein [Mytilus galloprovincialis]
MALSNSLQSGQVPMLCQMCEESNEIKWKCLQCDFLLCTKCQQLHQKVKSTDQHIIIDIKDITTYQQEVNDHPDIINIPCSVHNGQNCCQFCKTCEEIICSLCFLQAHNTHDMIGLAKEYELTLKAVNNFHTEVEENILQIEKGLSKLCIRKTSEESLYESEKQKILKRERTLKDEIEMHTHNLLMKLDHRRDFFKKSVQNEENRSKKLKKELEIRRESLDHTLKQNNATEVFNIFKQERQLRADSKQRMAPANSMMKGLPQYVPGKQPILMSQHGVLTELGDKEQYKFEFQVLQQFKTKLKIVENLVCCEDGSMWINYTVTNKLRKIQLKKGSEPATGEIKRSIFSFASLQTLAVHVTKANQIIVGVKENGEPFPVNGPRQVIVMDMNGRKEKMYHLDNNGQSIFTVPARITSDNDNNCYVLDRLNADFDGRIVALNKTNGIRWVYSYQYINKQRTFTPKDLTATQSDNIIVADSTHHIIHIIDTYYGQCVYYLYTKDQLGIQLPFSLDFDNTGTLYIGCSTYKSGSDEAKLYTVQVSGFCNSYCSNLSIQNETI